MEIVAGQLDWSTNDEENFAKFLDTETGRRFLPKLLEGSPLLLEKGHVNAILIRSGEVRGYQFLARQILELAHPSAPPLKEPEVAYPSLEDDKHWDGKKLNDPNPKID